MKKQKRIISILLSFSMLLGIITSSGIYAIADDSVLTSCDFNYRLLDNGTAEITKYNGKIDKLVIPETIDNHLVTIIGEWAFGHCPSLVTIKLPNSILSIKDYAFYCCSNLQNIDFSDKLISIGKYSFGSCKNLSGTLNLPNSLKHLGVSAFDSCKNITNVVIGDNLEDFINTEFATLPHGMMEKYKLEHITVSENNKYYSSKDGVLFNKDKSELLLYPDSKKDEIYYIPNTVEKISNGAFISTCYLNNITITSNVESIDYAFFNTSLDKVTILNPNCFIGEHNRFDKELETNTIFYGYKGSTVQNFANQNRCKFIELNENPIIAESTNTEYYSGSNKEVSIHCSYPLEEFISVSIDGQTLDKTNYSLTEGSTILTFKPSYLECLKEGMYNVSLNYTIGTVDTTIKVIKETNPIDKTGNAEKQTEAIVYKSEPKTNKDTKSPSTGNESIVPVAMMLILSGCIVVLTVIKKKRFKA